MIPIRWTERAALELEDAAEFIARDNRAAAQEVARRVLRATRKLGELPYAGKPGRVAGTRELVVPNTPLIVVYEVGSEAVGILSVWHTSRDWPTH